LEKTHVVATTSILNTSTFRALWVSQLFIM